MGFQQKWTPLAHGDTLKNAHAISKPPIRQRKVLQWHPMALVFFPRSHTPKAFKQQRRVKLPCFGISLKGDGKTGGEKDETYDFLFGPSQHGWGNLAGQIGSRQRPRWAGRWF